MLISYGKIVELCEPPRQAGKRSQAGSRQHLGWTEEEVRSAAMKLLVKWEEGYKNRENSLTKVRRHLQDDTDIKMTAVTLDVGGNKANNPMVGRLG